MLISKIKQNLAGFAAVVIAAVGFVAVAPAHATGTTTTAGQVGYSYSQRGTATTSANTVTINTTVAANQKITSSNVSVSLATVGSPVVLQSGDSLRVTAVYSNLTSNATVASISNNMLNITGASASVNAYSMVNGSAGSVAREAVLTNGGGFTAGSITQMNANTGVNWNSGGQSVGDQIRVVYTFELVRGGIPSALAVRSTSGASFSAVSSAADSSLAISSDTTVVQYQVDAACVWRGENGVTGGSVIDVTLGQSGSAGTLNTTSVNTWVQGSMGSSPVTPSNNTFSLTMPAGTAYDNFKFSVMAVVSSPVSGATFTPTLTAVLHGTSTNVLDTCARTNVSQTAPTATANGSGGVVLNWTAPANPSAYTSTWDNVTVVACTTTLNTCGTVAPGGMYVLPNYTPVAGYEYRFNGILAANATTATITAGSMMPYQLSAGQQITAWSAANDYRYFVLYSSMNGAYVVTTPVTAAISATPQQQQQQQQVQNNSAPQVPTNIPVIAPIAIPAAGIQPGGALVLDGRNLSSLKSIKIDATSTTTVTTSAGVEVKVPTDLAPGSHDLLITTATGSTLFVGAIKIADPAVVAAKQAQAKAAASISFRAPIDFNIGKSVSSAQSSQVKALATQYKTGKSAICVAVPASKATVAAATAAAAKVCATIKAAIPGIKTTVVVGDPSGDKNNRVESEIQG